MDPGRLQEPGLHGWRVIAFWVGPPHYPCPQTGATIKFSLYDAMTSHLYSSPKSQNNIFKDAARDMGSICRLFAYLAVSYRQSMVSGEALQFIPMSASRVIGNCRNCRENEKPQQSCCRWPFIKKAAVCVQASVTGYKVWTHAGQIHTQQTNCSNTEMPTHPGI